ncbi:NAD(P)/FAD-dependent oxidoreductase [Aquincola sp. S2]|uniref:NAD(P)/FAD-dependent oxidoreductase n=1 Tax=Pseudaquabacterium terrae TaxID=2732868 RepID=A0ABX2EIV5_9BURK|nr:NAD(P)/FAD-dependent oxidoreductase [Aquabacterium terrae]NRF68530.1 NAD(P)/FAD-dependent oxidoreductase [Aquabacterium terrae]
MAPAPLDTLIVGAGFSGLGLGIRLKQAGRHGFQVIERAAGVGGTWWANRYPGAACDIPSLLYSYSFAPNRRWSRLFPQQPEIQAYLAECVEDFGLGPHLRLATELVALRWHEDQSSWEATLRAADGTLLQQHARSVVIATGALSKPRTPDIEGLQDFGGRLLHTADWDRSLPLEGQRIGVIGTGASSIQLVPELAPLAVKVSVFQRTPAWIMPRHDRPLTAWQRTLCATLPGFGRAWRTGLYWQHEARVAGFTTRPHWLARAESLALRHMKKQVRDPALREALTPRYRMGCKRILISDDFYPALTRPNVELVTAPIQRIEPQGVRTADGRLHALDVLVTATGFDAADAGPPCPVDGPQGRTLAEAWRHGASAYLGTLVAGFPNLFFLVGPNTGLGHNSMLQIIESQLNLVLDALRRLDHHPTLGVTEEAHHRFDDEIQRRLTSTVWATGGCRSWYQARDGRITTLWPGSTIEFRRRTRRLALADFHLR